MFSNLFSSMFSRGLRPDELAQRAAQNAAETAERHNRLDRTYTIADLVRAAGSDEYSVLRQGIAYAITSHPDAKPRLDRLVATLDPKDFDGSQLFKYARGLPFDPEWDRTMLLKAAPSALLISHFGDLKVSGQDVLRAIWIAAENRSETTYTTFARDAYTTIDTFLKAAGEKK
jgi:hypothetical protein